MAGRRRMKSVEQSIADTDEPTTRLRKDLTWWDLVVFGVSVVIGAGIFTVTASTAGDITGPAIWISFLIAAATCALAALCYAEFASTLPVAGSAYTFSYATFGEFLAWVIGWNLVLELAMGAAVVAKGWSSYLGTVFGFGNGTGHLGSLQLDWGALVIVTLVATLIALGTKLSSRFSAVVTAIKVSVVVLVVVVGAFYIRAANYSPFIPEPEVQHHGGGLDQSVFSLLTGAQGSHYGWYGVLAGASIVFFAFIGFDIVATMAEETKRPQRDVPRGILASLGVVTLLYVAVSVVLSGRIRWSGGCPRSPSPRPATGTSTSSTTVAITSGCPHRRTRRRRGSARRCGSSCPAVLSAACARPFIWRPNGCVGSASAPGIP